MNGVVGRILGQILIVFLPFPGHKWPLFRRRSSTCCNIAFNTTWVLRIFFLSGFPYTNSNSSRYSLFELNLTSQDLTTLNAESQFLLKLKLCGGLVVLRQFLFLTQHLSKILQNLSVLRLYESQMFSYFSTKILLWSLLKQ